MAKITPKKRKMIIKQKQKKRIKLRKLKERYVIAKTKEEKEKIIQKIQKISPDCQIENIIK